MERRLSLSRSLCPGHVDIGGNSAADSAAKYALVGNISVELIPFSDLKTVTNKYVLEPWQSERDERSHQLALDVTND